MPCAASTGASSAAMSASASSGVVVRDRTVMRTRTRDRCDSRWVARARSPHRTAKAAGTIHRLTPPAFPIETGQNPQVLTPFDDYPVHQTPEPIAQPSSGDRNVYDRYFFNGYRADSISSGRRADAELYFAAAWGLYPNRAVQDAAFSVVRGGEQISIHASRRAPTDRVDMTVGPITVEVVEPLRALRLLIGPNESGVEGDLLFRNTTA